MSQTPPEDDQNGEKQPFGAELFGLKGSDPELLNSGRIPDPIPEHTALFGWLARILNAVEARLRAVGGVSLRWVIRLIAGLVAAVGVFLLVGPVINAPLNFDDVIASAEVDEVDWIARDVQIDYAVERDENGMFAARVDEQFDADFRNGPEPVVERTILTDFAGHDVEFELLAATIDGESVDAEVIGRATTTELRLTRPDGLAFEGEQQIQVSYELHHLIVPETDETTGNAIDRLSWPLFAPTWPQATKGIDVSLTLAHDIDEALVREPQAYVGWLLVSGVAWLEPEGETADGVLYSFSNDDTLPPNADIWINASFREGTFELPPKTELFWLQTYGPLVPLGLLVVLLVFGLAARRVVWADSAGDPWYSPRSDPPDNMSPELAAHLLRRSRHAELMDSFQGGLAQQRGATGRKRRSRGLGRGADDRDAWTRTVAEAGHRAGRLGNLPSMWRWAARWRLGKAVAESGLRWVPDSYVRDIFMLVPIALTLVQWGLLRQLSHQVILLVVWWPVAFVAISTLLTIATVAAVWRPRPLTRDGARAVQQLKGIDVYARTTRLQERGPLDDPLLPYALLFERPRTAGRVVVEHAARESGGADPGRNWRTEHFISAPALLALVAAFTVLAGAIITVSTQPTPYDMSADRLTRHNSLPGTFYTEVQGFEISAELDRGEDGRALLNVTETHTVRFEGTASRVPQFAREWPGQRFGQDLGLEIGSVRIDGSEVPHREVEHGDSTAVVTQLEEVLDGSYEVQVDYRLANAAIATRIDGEPVEQVRWTAWFSFWEDEYYTEAGAYFDGRSPVRPIRIELTVDPELVGEMLQGGWIDSDHDRSRTTGEHGNWFGPWTYDNRVYAEREHEEARPDSYELRVGSETLEGDGSLVVAIDIDAVESRQAPESGEETTVAFEVDPEVNEWLGRFELNLSSIDLGAHLDFAPGTFAGLSTSDFDRHLVLRALPFQMLVGLALAVTAASAGVIVYCVRRKERASLSLATVSYLAIPAAAAAQSVLFFWIVSTMSGSDARGGWALAAGALMVSAMVTQVVVVARNGLKQRGDQSG